MAALLAANSWLQSRREALIFELACLRGQLAAARGQVGACRAAGMAGDGLRMVCCCKSWTGASRLGRPLNAAASGDMLIGLHCFVTAGAPADAAGSVCAAQGALLCVECLLTSRQCSGLAVGLPHPTALLRLFQKPLAAVLQHSQRRALLRFKACRFWDPAAGGGAAQGGADTEYEGARLMLLAVAACRCCQPPRTRLPPVLQVEELEAQLASQCGTLAWLKLRVRNQFAPHLLAVLVLRASQSTANGSAIARLFILVHCSPIWWPWRCWPLSSTPPGGFEHARQLASAALILTGRLVAASLRS